MFPPDVVGAVGALRQTGGRPGLFWDKTGRLRGVDPRRAAHHRRSAGSRRPDDGSPPRDAATKAAGVFIGYRRADTGYVAGRLSDRLVTRLGEDRVFMDVDSIEPGIDFQDAIIDALGRSAVLLVLIGPSWAGPDAGGSRDIDDPNDLVRIEIEEGLRRGLRIIPILVDDTPMPARTDLPESLAALARRNAATVRQASFRRDATQLLDLAERVIAGS